MRPFHFLCSCLAAFIFWGSFAVLPAQNTFTPYKLTLFEDAALIAAKGILSFDHQKTELPITMPLVPASIDLVASNGDTKPVYFKIREDSIPGNLSVGTWGEVLRANMGRRITIVYDAGMEVDEVTGEVAGINAGSGMLLLRGSEENQYFIPFAEIKQVIVQGEANFRSPRKVVRSMLEIGIDKNLPFVPMEMRSVHKGIAWVPVGRIRITGPEKVILQTSALIQNDLADFQDIEVELSASEILSESHQSGEAQPAGRLSLRKGEQLSVSLRENELQYAAAYQCTIPHDAALGDGVAHRFPVQNIIRLNATSLPGLPCKSYSVLDENNRQIAQIPLTPNGKNGQLELLLGEEGSIIVHATETGVKRSHKVEQIGGLPFHRLSIQAKIHIFNGGQKFAQIQVQRDLKGELTANDKAKVEENLDEPSIKSLVWKFSLEKGSKKDVDFSYDALIPANEK